MSKNFLKLNADKTKLMFFGSEAQINLFDDLNICFERKILDKPDNASVKTLGVYLDHELTMARQINELCKSCNFHLKRFQRVRYCFDIDLRILLVKTFILAKMDFCNGLLATTNLALLNKLQKVLNACARFIYDLKKRDNVSFYLSKAHILPIKQRVVYKLCSTVFKILNASAPIYLNSIVRIKAQPVDSRYDFRLNSDVLQIETSEKCSGCISNKMTLYWNNLPIDIRYITDFSIFKTQLKTHLFRESYSEFIS